ncbi:fibronectin type III domain-containing protein [Nocardioides sp. Y6]|uniref:Fibronectin type III domain-containing protein n=1 Tax=Nocardioides malaquae TaxID=2773426 RepID=A0ABR9RW46_9ACTN|nr:fibronectin type III domain-containing protein [Nocardioides malaquae]MBE7325811.1 fibronectin type III domain-containing protein [Nocardioides malaquae]
MKRIALVVAVVLALVAPTTVAVAQSQSDPERPNPPANVQARVDGLSVIVTWDAPVPNGVEITGYTVITNSGPLGPRCDTDGALTCTFEGLPVNTQLRFSVVANGGGGLGFSYLSAESNPVVITIDPVSIPGAPVDVRASVQGSAVTVTWAPPTTSEPVTGYTVITNSGPLGPRCDTAGALTCTFEDLAPGEYWFQVVAVNDAGMSLLSERSETVVVGGVTPSPTPEPSPEPTASPTAGPTPVPTPTAEPTPTPTPTVEPTPVPTPTPTVEPTPTTAPTPTPTVEPTPSPTPTVEPTPSPTPSPSPSPTTSPSPEPDAKPITMVRAPRIKGQARVGRVLKATRGVWRPGRAKVRYQWFVKRGKRFAAVKHGDRARLKVTRALKGKRLRVRVTVRAAGHETYVFTSRPTVRVRRR